MPRPSRSDSGSATRPSSRNSSTIEATETAGTARVRVRNTGDRAGSTVVQVYAVDTQAARPVPQLVGFRRVDLDAGAETIVDVGLDLTPTRERDPGTRVWSRRPGSWAIVAAPCSPAGVEGSQELSIRVR